MGKNYVGLAESFLKAEQDNKNQFREELKLLFLSFNPGTRGEVT